MNPTTKTAGYVYVIHATGTNRIKVGYSTSPKDRLAQLQTGSPFPLQLLASWPGGEDRERRVHRYLNQFRQIGEWFEVPPFIGLQIYDLVTKGSVTGSVKQVLRPTVFITPKGRSAENTRRYNKSGRPCVEASRMSVNAWYIRLRWNQKPGRPVKYCCTLTDKEYMEIRQAGWPEYKEEILAKYHDGSN